MKTTIALFDIDGVLVHSGGYRVAVYATMNRFTEEMGLGKIPPDEAVLSLFEAQGITNEFDMQPVLLAAILEKILRMAQPQAPLGTIQEAFDWVRSLRLDHFDIHYDPTVRGLYRFLNERLIPSEAIIRASEKDPSCLFPRLYTHPVFMDMFGKTRSVTEAVISKTFETYVMGSERYFKLFNAAPDFETESYITLYDQNLLDEETRKRLLQIQEQGHVTLASMTARPSLSPDGVDSKSGFYSPEAELALEMTGLDPIHLVGYGSMVYLGARLGFLPHVLLKPAPVQALATVATCWSGEALKSLNWAGKIFTDKLLKNEGHCTPADLDGMGKFAPQELELHIFEDSPVGILACQRAGKIFNEMGITTTVHAWGISGNPDKEKALSRLGAQIFPDVNQAVRAAF